MDDTRSFLSGVDWFRQAHDSAAGAWGFFPGAEAQVLPTCMAVIALSLRDGRPEPVIRDVVNRGVEWLLARQRAGGDPGWGAQDDRPGSAVHTAWALRALVAAGYDPYSPAVAAGREWLLDNVADRESIIDRYVTPGRSMRGHRRPTRAITHISFPDGIIVHGLLRSGVNLLDQRLLGAMDDLIVGQHESGFWRCSPAPRDQPIFAVMDACLALRLFVDGVQRQESVLEISERLRHAEEQLTAVRNRVEELVATGAGTETGIVDLTTRLEQTAQRLDTQVSRIGAIGDEAHRIRERLIRLDQGLAVLYPMMWLTRLVRRWPMLTILVVLQLVAYGLTAFTVPAEFRILTGAAGVLLTLTTAITFWSQVRGVGAQAGPAGRGSTHVAAPSASASSRHREFSRGRC
jgi:hypothetical protein